MAEYRLTPTPAIAAAPVEIGGTRLAPRAPEAVQTLVLRTQDPAALAAAIEAALGPLPAIGQSALTRAGAVLLRPSRERGLLIGRCPALTLTPNFHAVDQTGFWAMIALEGESARSVLERHWRPDLGDTRFPPGAVAQSSLSGVAVTLFRESAQGFGILAPRSYAAWLFDELATTLLWVC
ncbi:hypothetical protein [Sinisalibacter lacisalsi]|uniref:Sarcosine oxidase subunit gamma n=1 Tax=Sinisalibacter lacisalsi TaxID=1526570 RepID=A0ABQ1QHV2_9RHOB|nr:hypothetical protein [Sinisalibacter lacisalsi]GGD28252.1 hypothetical protein GCM10011358_10540 [Sinisalibacter lacisalsi]